MIYTGSTSRTVGPSLRLGWLAVPPPLRDPILTLQQTAGSIPSPIVQLAFADQLGRGEVDRHLRRQRRRYQRQRAAQSASALNKHAHRHNNHDDGQREQH